MLEANINIFDAAVIGIIVLSALLSFFRGFLREVFSLGTWAGASVITLYAYPTVAKMLADKLSNTQVANGLASIGTFLGALLILSIIGAVLLKYLKPSNEVGMVDNTLGLIFGVLRGALLVAVAFYIMSLFLKPEDYPAWVQEAKTKSYVEEIALLIGKIAPEYIAKMVPKPGDPALGEALDELVPEGDNNPNSINYEDSETQWPAMDDLQNTLEQEQQNVNDPYEPR